MTNVKRDGLVDIVIWYAEPLSGIKVLLSMGMDVIREPSAVKPLYLGSCLPLGMTGIQ